MGGRSPPPRHLPPAGGGRGGTRSALGKRHAGPAPKGGRAGLGPVLSLSRMRSRCGTPTQLFFAPAGANRCRRIKLLRRPTVSPLSLATVVAPTALSLIGCTILRAVSGILRTQCGRRGSGPRETICNRAVALLPPSWLDLRPCGSSIALWLYCRSRGSFAAPVAWLSPLWLNCRRPCGLAPAPVARLPSLLWLGSRPCGSTAVCLGSSLPCQIKPGPSYAAAVIGVQRGAGLSWRDGVCLLARRALYFTWAASGG